MSEPSAAVKSARRSQKHRAAVTKLRAYYDLGQKIVSEEKENGCSIAEAIEESGWEGSVDTAYKSRQFASLISSELFQAMSREDAQHTLTWTHVVTLLSVPDAKQREKYLTSALQGGWSTSRLRAEVGVRAPKRRLCGRRFPDYKTRSEAYQALERHLTRPLKFLNRLVEQSKVADDKQDHWILEQLATTIMATQELIQALAREPGDQLQIDLADMRDVVAHFAKLCGSHPDARERKDP